MNTKVETVGSIGNERNIFALLYGRDGWVSIAWFDIYTAPTTFKSNDCMYGLSEWMNKDVNANEPCKMIAENYCLSDDEWLRNIVYILNGLAWRVNKCFV